MYIGIDLGTSSVKLLLMENDGKILKKAVREYGLSFPHTGWSEQDPADWIKGTVDGVKELMEGQPKDAVKGIGIGGQMHGLVMLDKDDNVIRPAILWNDGRTIAETDYLNNEIGRDKLLEYTGNIAFAGFTAPKILWVKKNEPDNFAKATKFMLPKDYLVYKLSGAFTTDMSDASGTLYFDVEKGGWSDPMLGILGITADKLPEVHKGFEIVGEVKDSVKSELGLSGSVKVCAGAGDNAAAAVGMGIAGAGKCNISVGTSGTIFLTSDSYRVDPSCALHSFRHADGQFHFLGCMLSAASCNKWWMDEIFKTKDYAGEQKEIAKLGENSVFFLPYLMGERSPHNDAAVRGSFTGLSLDTTRADIYQAVLEGVAFGIRDMLEAGRKAGYAPEESCICGGGAKSPLWRQIIANVTGLKLITVENDEGPSYGGAILAAVGCGEFATVAQASEAVTKTGDITVPEKELIEKYNDRYAHYTAIYPAVKDLYR